MCQDVSKIAVKWWTAWGIHFLKILKALHHRESLITCYGMNCLQRLNGLWRSPRIKVITCEKGSVWENISY